MSISKDNSIIQVIISKQLKTQLEEKAKKENRSVSNYVLTILTKDLKNSSHT